MKTKQHLFYLKKSVQTVVLEENLAQAMGKKLAG